MAYPVDQDPLGPPETGISRGFFSGVVPGWVRDLIDRWRHPGESDAMRRYRRWRDDTGRGAYLLSSVREISGPSRIEVVPWTVPDDWEVGIPKEEIEQRFGRIVGVRMEKSSPE